VIKYYLIMKNLILIRYGQHQNGHLTPEGVKVMALAGARLKLLIEGKATVVIASSTPRAFESGKIIADILKSELTIDESLYAAEEDGKFPDNTQAKAFVENFGNNVDVLVAITSREYIETLPAYILEQPLNTNLERGECLVIDYESKSISYIKDN
jgi:phosphohistidine phosphatase SixA